MIAPLRPRRPRRPRLASAGVLVSTLVGNSEPAKYKKTKAPAARNFVKPFRASPRILVSPHHLDLPPRIPRRGRKTLNADASAVKRAGHRRSESTSAGRNGGLP